MAQFDPVRWGILGAARIADGAVIPGMVASADAVPLAIGARDLTRAQAMAEKHGIARAYGSYDEVLADPDVEAVYIALPNHLHVEWARKAADAGKHVLIEKPGAMRAADYAALKGVDPALKISEAFMVRQQPRWIKLRDILRSGDYGAPLTFSSLLSFMMTNEQDFRQKPEWGGGAYYDLGCYTAMAARYFLDAEPLRVMALMERNAGGIDMFTSVIMDFGKGRQASFMVSLAQASSQSIQIVCERAFVTLPQAYVPSRSAPNMILIDTSADHANSDITSLEFPALDQYKAEVTNFSRAVRGEDAPYFDLADARANAAVCDAVFASAASGGWALVKGA
ncbi:Gfo/Idh/MocA family protein [Paracoccus fistulariae]|uniref:Gfo/Idh/MocA family oxidoreductase n=1 Tax=Paracoccus fistulariae TaxID=658446 RepID=A0ABY7SP53_9RHOB|nr:Gfo/Idh/MocA family oxidoreductase [Paracoccus fistulariae]MDB6182252.1 Gfo/Idh/MocA family oxidoreductase [Paracoccus fistulariae]WCR08761.1 Gfo/Idh/MocA family oxidoreductase [Paracoccus fistulariae]